MPIGGHWRTSRAGSLPARWRVPIRRYRKGTPDRPSRRYRRGLTPGARRWSWTAISGPARSRPSRHSRPVTHCLWTASWGPLTWAALNESPSGAQPYPAPAGVAAGSVSLSVTWAAVEVSGKVVESYTVQAVGLNGQVYATETPAANSVVLSGLVRGWTYNILVSANGGPVAPQHASIKVTL